MESDAGSKKSLLLSLILLVSTQVLILVGAGAAEAWADEMKNLSNSSNVELETGNKMAPVTIDEQSVQGSGVMQFWPDAAMGGNRYSAQEIEYDEPRQEFTRAVPWEASTSRFKMSAPPPPRQCPKNLNQDPVGTGTTPFCHGTPNNC